MNEISSLRVQLETFLVKLREAESVLMKRASRLWGSNICTEEELDKYIEEVESLKRAFEGCENDVDDFCIMKGALQAYKRYYNQLHDNNLSWREFESLFTKLRQEADTAFREEEALPWTVEDMFKNFLEIISTERKQESSAWIESIEHKVSSIDSIPIREVNRVRSKVVNPPAVLTDEHKVKLSKVIKQIDKCLEENAVEAFVEKFKELPITAQNKIIKRIT